MVSNKATRALLSQSATLFTQANKRRSTQTISSSEMVKTSRKYRSVIHATSESIVVEDDASLELFKMMSNIEMVWHLCEILFLDSHPPGVLLNQLLSWIRWHLNHRSMIMAEQVVKCGRRATDHPSYWKVLYHFIFSGQTDQIVDWLNLYKSSIQSPGNEPDQELERTNIAIQIISKMPIYNYGQLSHEVDMRWSIWSNEVKEILATEFFNGSPVELIMQLFAGNEHSLNTIATRKENELTWMHLLVAKILFRDPFMKESDLSTIASEAIDTFNSCGHSDVTVMDRTLHAAFNYDLMQVVKEACQFNDNWWFVAHFVDLLYCGDSLSCHGIEAESKLRDFLVLDFADNLMTHESLWRIGVDYYDWSGTGGQNDSVHETAINSNGRYRLELMLERVPLKSESVAYKILDIAQKRNLKSLTKSVCRSVARNWIKRGNLSSALTWSLRSEDSGISSFIANQMLLKYSQNGRSSSSCQTNSCVIDSDILSSLGPSMLVSEKLTFLAKYYELKQLMKRPELGHEAAQLLVTLISSKISPPFFLMTLLADSVNLLNPVQDMDTPIDYFTADACCTLLAALESLIDLRKSPLAKKGATSLGAINTGVINDGLIMDDDEFERREIELRNAVSKCLSRTIVNGF